MYKRRIFLQGLAAAGVLTLGAATPAMAVTVHGSTAQTASQVGSAMTPPNVLQYISALDGLIAGQPDMFGVGSFAHNGKGKHDFGPMDGQGDFGPMDGPGDFGSMGGPGDMGSMGGPGDMGSMGGPGDFGHMSPMDDMGGGHRGGGGGGGGGGNLLGGLPILGGLLGGH